MNDAAQGQPAGLISVLRDRNAPFADRDDAAMDLAAFDAPESEGALVSILLDPEEDRDLAETVAESLGEIWVRNGRLDRDLLRRLTGTAANMLAAVLDKNWPEWRLPGV